MRKYVEIIRIDESGQGGEPIARATMLYYHTRDILLVRKLLGHKKIENTMKYTQIANFKDDDYVLTTASTEDEIKALGKAGFAKYDEHNGIHFYRKPKRFVSLA